MKWARNGKPLLLTFYPSTRCPMQEAQCMTLLYKCLKSFIWVAITPMAVSPSANRLDFTPIRCNCVIDCDIACNYIVIILIFTMVSHYISQHIFDNNCLLLKLVSYNWHGINQGFHAIRDIIASYNPDIFLLQEHRLTPDKLSTFSRIFPDYSHYDTSAMSSDVYHEEFLEVGRTVAFHS